jgi:hypothetical protein
MIPVRYDIPSIEIQDSAVTEEFFWAGAIAFSAIAVIGTLAAICQIQGGNLSWGINWGGPFGLVPSGIWYKCTFH